MTNPVITILDEVKALVANFEKQRKELVDKLSPAFAEIFQPFLTKYPDVQQVYFTAYTPYFNDGDPCHFRVHDLYYDTDEEYELGDYYGPTFKDVIAFKNTGVLNEDAKTYVESYIKPSYRYDYNNYSRGRIETPARYATLEEAFADQYASLLSLSVEQLEQEGNIADDFRALRELFGSIPDDIIEQLFDEGKIIITRDGVTEEEYSHD